MRSANKRHLVKVQNNGSLAFSSRGDDGQQPLRVTEGRLQHPGHHGVILVPDSGRRFVVFDCYSGISIHRRDGKLVKRLAPKDLLSAAELRKRPGRWACHGEGEWSRHGPVPLRGPGKRPAIVFDAEATRVRVILYTGKQVWLSLDTGAKVAPPAAE